MYTYNPLALPDTIAEIVQLENSVELIPLGTEKTELYELGNAKSITLSHPSYKSKFLISAGTRNEFEREYFYGDRDEYVLNVSRGVHEEYAVGTENEFSVGLRNEFKQKNLYKDRNGDSSVTIESESEIKFTSQALDFTSYEPKNLTGIVDSGCVLYKGYDEYASPNAKLEATARYRFESKDTDGTTTKMAYGGSCELGIFEQRAEANFESSIKKDDLTFFESEGSVKAKTGVDGEKLDAKLGSTLIKVHDEDAGVEIKFLKASAEAKVEVDKDDGITDMVRAGVSLVEAEVGALKSKIGVNIDTGVSIDKDGAEVSVGL
ncbi:hypothetical protein Glove_85g14 [Diversispora epigaea]|uniref:Uncharacterized protein n=1 Tax=Diversispora epigaea TaxID=1348612 RepID=A0A397J726_9GLOM|nr:hypothetical protein Glove_85g14 [Diversispora epigaea]